ncbi:hypothetical protein GDO81_015513, partial [Engystomops pustulosus]
GGVVSQTRIQVCNCCSFSKSPGGGGPARCCAVCVQPAAAAQRSPGACVRAWQLLSDMAAKKAGSRLEVEIERCRSECQWDRIHELVKQLSAKLISNDDMAELLLGEAKLEQYLKDNPLKQGTSPRGPRPKLTDVRKHLTAALDRGNLKSDLMQEANMIMAKLDYVEGDYKEALGIYSRVGLDDIPLAASPPYKLRMIAEAYSTKGLCLEKLPTSSSTNSLHVDRDQEIITCYEKAGDIALLYLQEVERVQTANIQNRSPKPGPAAPDQEMSFFLETGLQRAHVLYFKNGNLTRGVGRFREILSAVEPGPHRTCG